jgi:hypothetical protein
MQIYIDIHSKYILVFITREKLGLKQKKERNREREFQINEIDRKLYTI